MGLIICGRLLNPMLTSAKGNRLSFSTQKVGIGGRGVAYIYIYICYPLPCTYILCVAGALQVVVATRLDTCSTNACTQLSCGPR